MPIIYKAFNKIKSVWPSKRAIIDYLKTYKKEIIIYSLLNVILAYFRIKYHSEIFVFYEKSLFKAVSFFSFDFNAHPIYLFLIKPLAYTLEFFMTIFCFGVLYAYLDVFLLSFLIARIFCNKTINTFIYSYNIIIFPALILSKPHNNFEAIGAGYLIYASIVFICFIIHYKTVPLFKFIYKGVKNAFNHR